MSTSGVCFRYPSYRGRDSMKSDAFIDGAGFAGMHMLRGSAFRHACSRQAMAWAAPTARKRTAANNLVEPYSIRDPESQSEPVFLENRHLLVRIQAREFGFH